MRGKLRVRSTTDDPIKFYKVNDEDVLRAQIAVHEMVREILERKTLWQKFMAYMYKDNLG